MQLTLTLTGKQAAVAVDGAPSHTFPLAAFQTLSLEDPAALGKTLFAALFPEGSPARAALEAGPDRLLLVAADEALDALPWEFLHGPEGYLGLDVPIVRGLPPEQRIASASAPPPDRLRVLAVASNPIGVQPPLDIEGEWERLRQAVEATGRAVVLQRVRPPSPEGLRRALNHRAGAVIHFMGHGGEGGYLLFEDGQGSPKKVTARDLLRRIRNLAFLVTLNACVSAAPSPDDDTGFANIARALVAHGVPYALGMRFPIGDEDAKAFSRALFAELATGVPPEEAVMQVRVELADRRNPYAVGIPVLYTALEAPAPGFPTPEGAAQVDDGQPPMEVDAVPRAAGASGWRVW